MQQPGQIALMDLAHTDFAPGKRRPVLLVAQPPGPYDDWLVCMLSTQQAIAGFDEIVRSDAPDFAASGLRTPSVIRVARLAVVSSDLLIGALGGISDDRLQRVRRTIAGWIMDEAREMP